eukprot:TRINITY_DN1723_c0_g1_i2.p2 TRINITY_DN1723_c0_g1~~TRINITY_DN1723_c0_g1_i2.p2  ORF type:complete len:258 (-),score=70.98 TRINITY_DN1723_c0_g1_i2:37-810(-)
MLDHMLVSPALKSLVESFSLPRTPWCQHFSDHYPLQVVLKTEQTPGTPGTPETPETPNPEAPGTPETPGSPETPTPETPTPETPGTQIPVPTPEDPIETEARSVFFLFFLNLNCGDTAGLTQFEETLGDVTQQLLEEILWENGFGLYQVKCVDTEKRDPVAKTEYKIELTGQGAVPAVDYLISHMPRAINEAANSTLVSPVDDQRGSKVTGGIIAAVIVGVIFVVLLIVGLLFYHKAEQANIKFKKNPFGKTKVERV